MANCRNPYEILMENIQADDRILRALNNGHGKVKEK
jgi:hypothetical protein